jgi:hypothetical protein
MARFGSGTNDNECHEPIAALRYGLDERRAAGPEGFAYSRDIDAQIDFLDEPARPDLPQQFVLAHELRAAAHPGKQRTSSAPGRQAAAAEAGAPPLEQAAGGGKAPDDRSGPCPEVGPDPPTTDTNLAASAKIGLETGYGWLLLAPKNRL